MHALHVIASLAVMVGAFGLIMFDGGNPHHRDHNPPRRGF
jgi:hypothetical protein